MSAKSQKWYLYIIECVNGTLYTGITTDVARRFQEHADQGPKCAKYLKGKAPLQLVFTVYVGEKGDAYRLEKRVKSMSKKKKLRLVSGKISFGEI